MTRKLRGIDLFAGKRGWSAAFNDRGHYALAIDNDPQHNPDWLADIGGRDLLPALVADGPWDFVLASPPCETFSIASVSHHFTKVGDTFWPKSAAATQSLALVEATLNIIRELDPDFYVIENPRGMLRKMPQMQHLDRRTVTYCQYGDTRMKPTDLWGNWDALDDFTLEPMCKNGDPCHERAPRGARTGTQGIKNRADRALVPYRLSLDICMALEAQTT